MTKKIKESIKGLIMFCVAVAIFLLLWSGFNSPYFVNVFFLFLLFYFSLFCLLFGDDTYKYLRDKQEKDEHN